MHFLIQSLENNGYLSTPLEEIASVCHCSLTEAAEALALLQTLEPDGVGARTLGECLSIQLKKIAPDQALALRIVQDYLDLLGKNQIPAIAVPCTAAKRGAGSLQSDPLSESQARLFLW